MAKKSGRILSMPHPLTHHSLTLVLFVDFSCRDMPLESSLSTHWISHKLILFVAADNSQSKIIREITNHMNNLMLLDAVLNLTIFHVSKRRIKTNTELFLIRHSIETNKRKKNEERGEIYWKQNKLHFRYNIFFLLIYDISSLILWIYLIDSVEYDFMINDLTILQFHYTSIISQKLNQIYFDHEQQSREKKIYFVLSVGCVPGWRRNDDFSVWENLLGITRLSRSEQLKHNF